jgi:hypothetical protein
LGTETPVKSLFFFSSGTRNYLFTFDGIDQLNRSGGVSKTMVQDILNAINALKNTAVGRCRQRIEEAAQKARELRGNGQTDEEKKRSGPGEPQCGVTSILKRKHGL